MGNFIAGHDTLTVVRRIGHRGAKGHAEENTIASFETAVALGCDEIEVDVWLADDGSLVIVHDRPASPVGLPTLGDVLDLCRGRMGVDLELKASGEAAAREIGARVGALLAGRADDSVYVSSFWWSALAAAHERAAAVRRAYLFASPPIVAPLIDAARRDGLWALHPDKARVTPELVRDAHLAGLAVQAWTVNEPDEIARLAAWDLDGIISDYPERVPNALSASRPAAPRL